MIPLFPNDNEFLGTIACAYLRKKKAVLVFVPTRDGCQRTATLLAQKLPVQFLEYRPARYSSPAVRKQEQQLVFTDLVTELREIVDNVV